MLLNELLHALQPHDGYRVSGRARQPDPLAWTSVVKHLRRGESGSRVVGADVPDEHLLREVVGVDAWKSLHEGEWDICLRHGGQDGLTDCIVNRPDDHSVDL